ncbi:MAG TPA: DUF4097 family beta strand repeat-containing protein [Candidatus Acidoferrales bacterium]|nr:DUF4097 family beta strand repeat-containing protein [Candidatus Acidoferrales bacterium]
MNRAASFVTNSALNLQTARKFVIAAGLLAVAIPAWGGTQIQKTLKLDPGGRFVLEADEGSVTLTGSDQSGATVVVTSYRDDFQKEVDLSFEEDAGIARVRERRRYWNPLEFLFDPLGLHYEIRVPKSTTLEIRTGGGAIKVDSTVGYADLKTSGGWIEMSNLTGDVHAHTSGGYIHADQIRGEIDVQTSGGGIEADSIDGELAADTSGGAIRINGVTGRVRAHTSGGSIEASLGRGNAKGGDLDTSGGSVYVRIDPAVNLNVDASSSGGGVTYGIPLRGVDSSWSRNAVRGTLGSGGELLRVHTSGGSVRLEAL